MELYDYNETLYECQSHPDLLKAFQAAAVAGNSANAGPSVKKPFNAAMVGENIPRAKGLDERARKKAAAKALLVRKTGGGTTQAPIPQDGAPSPHPNEANDGGKKDAKNQTSNGVVVSKGDEPKPAQQEQAPVGLGSGLGALDAKKLKTKSKGKATANNTVEPSN